MSELVHSFKVIDSILAQRIVGAYGSNTVVLPTSNATPLIGVSLEKQNVTGGAIPVQLDGLARVYFNDSVLAQALVTADASGYAVPCTLATISVWCVGMNLGNKVNDTGMIQEILILPQFIGQDS